MNKFHAVKTVYDGITFDSKAEARRYLVLLADQQAGYITGLKIHPSFELQQAFTHDGKRERAIFYEADFEYFRDGRRIVEDVKGGKATRTAVFELKRKMFLYQYSALITFYIIES